MMEKSKRGELGKEKNDQFTKEFNEGSDEL
jgi:hypothetical protein